MLEFCYPEKVKFFCGLIFKDAGFLPKAENLLKKTLGAIDFKSEILAFNYTNYYHEEMGTDLKRAFWSFKRLFKPEMLLKVKNEAVKIERKLIREKKRQVNIDPGYLNEAKVVLASTKDFSHRIYLGKGVFAEITLIYHKKSFQILPWTFPDYRSQEYQKILCQIRNIYRQQKSHG